MKIRFGRASIAWLSVSLAMYAAAVILTMTVTWARGGVLEHGDRPVDASPIVYLAFLVDEGAPPLGEDAVQVSLFGDDRNPVLRVFFRNGLQTVMVTNQLRDAHACAGNLMVEEVVGDLDAAVWHKVTLTGQHTTGCRLRPGISLPETFTIRSVTLIADSDRMTSFPSDEMENAAARGIPDRDVALRGLIPVPYILDLENFFGARDIKFHSYDTPTREGEAWRIVAPGEALTARWTDIYRQQFRDILLIVIGTLIGIGVTVMIEGLRPMIEGLGERSLVAPTGKKIRDQPAPTADQTPPPANQNSP